MEDNIKELFRCHYRSDASCCNYHWYGYAYHRVEEGCANSFQEMNRLAVRAVHDMNIELLKGSGVIISEE